ncbi:MAG TPA: hypothetical protein VEK32_22355 [Thermodesulfobacteriota bacterium]|nr:hypothetical protein [Thermodesulfobacteriota bacterium]
MEKTTWLLWESDEKMRKLFNGNEATKLRELTKNDPEELLRQMKEEMKLLKKGRSWWESEKKTLFGRLVHKIVSAYPSPKIRELSIEEIERCDRTGGTCFFCGSPAPLRILCKRIFKDHEEVILEYVCVDCWEMVRISDKELRRIERIQSPKRRAINVDIPVKTYIARMMSTSNATEDPWRFGK